MRELLRNREQILVRLRTPDEFERARAVLAEARVNGADWLGSAHLEKDRQGQETLHIDAPQTHSAEVNRLLSEHEIFATELHPYEGSLEEVYLQLTTPATATGEHLGMAALAGSSELLDTQEFHLGTDGTKKSAQDKGASV